MYLPQLNLGDEGVVIHANGMVELLLPSSKQKRHDLTEQHQALIGAAIRVTSDPDFRADNAGKFRLYLTEPQGAA